VVRRGVRVPERVDPASMRTQGRWEEAILQECHTDRDPQTQTHTGRSTTQNTQRRIATLSMMPPLSMNGEGDLRRRLFVMAFASPWSSSPAWFHRHNQHDDNSSYNTRHRPVNLGEKRERTVRPDQFSPCSRRLPLYLAKSMTGSLSSHLNSGHSYQVLGVRGRQHRTNSDDTGSEHHVRGHARRVCGACFADWMRCGEGGLDTAELDIAHLHLARHLNQHVAKVRCMALEWQG